ncbi:MAG: radical SAM protein [Planctomycetota bacterium]|jgi:molybdenum cofactor biosynthesis enzyme MoaA
MNSAEKSSCQNAPLQELESLDELWFQVGGTLCNLSCNHCFISCHPGNDNFGFIDLETVRRYLRESQALGVKEYYFTGGEPFLNRDMLPVLEETLAIGPATVLTNGTVFTPSSIKALRAISEESLFSLEMRVSIDGYNPRTNDPIRGEGTFEKALEGVKMLVEAGFLPIITMAQTWPEEENTTVFETFVTTLKEAGYQRPRIKILPTLHLGMEAERSRPYSQAERISEEMMEGYDSSQLLCSRSRTVTDRGVAVCPLLIEAPGAHLGDSLEGASGPYRLDQGACYTCYVHGAICSNIGGWGVE